MSQFNVPFLPSNTQIVNSDGTMTKEMQNFVQAMSNIFNNNFQSQGLKLPTIDKASNTKENGSTWYNNDTKTPQVLVDGKIHNIDTTAV